MPSMPVIATGVPIRVYMHKLLKVRGKVWTCLLLFKGATGRIILLFQTVMLYLQQDRCVLNRWIPDLICEAFHAVVLEEIMEGLGAKGIYIHTEEVRVTLAVRGAEGGNFPVADLT